MKERDDIQNELRQLAPILADVTRQMPYNVPDGYFDRFSAGMLEAARATPASDVPAGYFDNFATVMLQKVRSISVTEELDEVAPMLNRLDKTMPYHLPEGYFANWKPELATSIAQPAKVVKMGTGNWKQWAVAAAAVITMSLGWQFLVNKPADNTVVTATVTDPALDTLLNKVDANSLTGYLEDEQANSEFASLLMIAQQDVETSLKQLSDDELNWYMENRALEIPGS
jgi:hypothetical protein